MCILRGFLNNFEKGDNVHQLHKHFFSYCKMVLSKYFYSTNIFKIIKLFASVM